MSKRVSEIGISSSIFHGVKTKARQSSAQYAVGIQTKRECLRRSVRKGEDQRVTIISPPRKLQRCGFNRISLRNDQAIKGNLATPLTKACSCTLVKYSSSIEGNWER